MWKRISQSLFTGVSSRETKAHESWMLQLSSVLNLKLENSSTGAFFLFMLKSSSTPHLHIILIGWRLLTLKVHQLIGKGEHEIAADSVCPAVNNIVAGYLSADVGILI